jgi:protein-ribulosamine 3-kinase
MLVVSLIMAESIPPVLLQHLQRLEPKVDFEANRSFITSSEGKRYFGKIGSESEKEQYIGEAESLKAMADAAPGLAPRVLAFGVTDSSGNDTPIENHGRPYFLSEYKEMKSLTNEAAAALGKRLATELHMYKSKNGFGFGIPTYCGATRLENGWFETWEQCYDAMIGDLLTQLSKKGGYSGLCKKGDEVRRK